MKKNVLITGTSSGIGKALVNEFAKRGFRVFATSRSSVARDEFGSGDIHPIQMDVTRYREVDEVVDKIIAAEGGIDILVNNAGYGLMAPMLDITEDELTNQFLVNVYAPINLIKKIVHVMKDSKGRKTIVNIGSISGIVTTPFSGAYCASKAALHSFSDALRMELKPLGINVITIKPGAVKSNFGKRAMSTAKEILKDNSYYKSINSNIIKRANGSQVVATEASEFARKVVKKILMKNPPTNIRLGKKSSSLPFLKFLLPTKLLDSILSKKFGLDKCCKD